MTDYEKMRLDFENAAEKKGYSFDKDELGRYEDNWLQEAWEIFCLVDFKKQNSGVTVRLQRNEHGEMVYDK